jgi:hypothetical protein
VKNLAKKPDDFVTVGPNQNEIMMAFKWWIDEPFIRGSRNPSDEDLRRLRVLAEESPGSLILKKGIRNILT